MRGQQRGRDGQSGAAAARRGQRRGRSRDGECGAVVAMRGQQRGRDCESGAVAAGSSGKAGVPWASSGESRIAERQRRRVWGSSGEAGAGGTLQGHHSFTKPVSHSQLDLLWVAFGWSFIMMKVICEECELFSPRAAE